MIFHEFPGSIDEQNQHTYTAEKGSKCPTQLFLTILNQNAKDAEKEVANVVSSCEVGRVHEEFEEYKHEE